MTLMTAVRNFRPSRRSAVVALAAIALIMAISFAATALEDDDERTAPETSAAAGIIELTNTVRAANGLPGLAEDAALSRTAREFAAYLAGGGAFDHVDGDGRGPDARAAAAGYDGFEAVLENLAQADGGPDASAIMTSWLASQSHRDNLFAPGATDTGVACATSAAGVFCVQAIGVRPDAP